MDYESTISEIYSLAKFGTHLGLERISAILSELGNPQKKYPCIVVAGSNGKGSTVAFASSILQECGYKVGSYYSPHIVEFCERIQENGTNISQESVCEAFEKVKPAYKKLGLQPTFFEVVTAMAFWHFAQQKVDFAVVEVGMGGRLDAANAAEAKVAVITSIDLEHTAILGDTVEKIAGEKAGIIRQDCTAVIGEKKRGALNAIMQKCHQQGARTRVFGDDFEAVAADWQLGMPGELQRKNAALAIEAAKAAIGWKEKEDAAQKAAGRGKAQVESAGSKVASCAEIPEAKLKSALAKAHLACRFEQISEGPATILDVAHNPAAFENLCGEVAKIKKSPKVLVFGAMEDKDIFSMLKVSGNSFDALVLNQPSLDRAAKMDDVEQVARVTGWIHIHHVGNVRDSVEEARKLAGKGGLVIVAGSMYMLAEYFGKDKVIGM
jgi:dihydrofolate synthase/folylpolyglutamate synthase